MQETRKRFHDNLAALESDLVGMGEQAAVAVEKAVRSLVHKDVELALDVIAGDDALDNSYLDLERRVLQLLATQAPVATDLRLLVVILHTNVHLERVGDMAVNVAKLSKVTADLPSSTVVVSQLEEMGDVVTGMLRVAMRAFARRELALAESLPSLDDPVDRLNRNMYREVAALAADPSELDWGIRMNIVSRMLERVGDHAVDIGEQVAFLLTGEFREFTDASHPVGQ
jgi:phosphate transport system protein